MSKLSVNDLDHVLDHTRPLWDELRGGRLFVTGGTGFFGCWLLESFLWANQRLHLDAQAVVLTRDLQAFRDKAPHLADYPALHFHTGDVRSFEFPEGMFSHIIHAATQASVRLNLDQPEVMHDTIVVGTRRTLDFAQKCGAQKFLLTSSGAVYGPQPPDLPRIPEEHPAAPNGAYGEGKKAAEELCLRQAASTGLAVKIARGFAFVGPHLPLDLHFAIGNFLRDGLRGGPIVVQGDGTPRRSYLYAADLAVWLWTILFQGESSRPYNVGSEADLSIAEVAEAVADAFIPRPAIEILDKPTEEFTGAKSTNRYIPSTERAARELGLRQWIDLSEAIRRTRDWHRLAG
jgi:nucleoside-diphosphate-sugar epimerase